MICAVRPRVTALFLALGLGLAGPAGAELYRWVDADGGLHVTSDPSEVPARYRKQARPVGESSGGSVNIVPGANDSQRTQRLRFRNRQRDMDRMLEDRRERAAGRAASPPARRAEEPPPSKSDRYNYNCSRRTRNGRCQRTQTEGFKRWKQEQKFKRIEESLNGSTD